jgi:hypothetical protein
LIENDPPEAKTSGGFFISPIMPRRSLSSGGHSADPGMMTTEVAAHHEYDR